MTDKGPRIGPNTIWEYIREERISIKPLIIFRDDKGKQISCMEYVRIHSGIKYEEVDGVD